MATVRPDVVSLEVTTPELVLVDPALAAVQAVEVPVAKPPSRPSVPTSSPTRPRSVEKERRFAKAPDSAASGYHVEFFRGTARVLSRDTKGPTLAVPARWVSSGERHAFVKGDYRWHVWPVVAGRRTSQAIVQATFVIP